MTALNPQEDGEASESSKIGNTMHQSPSAPLPSLHQTEAHAEGNLLLLSPHQVEVHTDEDGCGVNPMDTAAPPPPLSRQQRQPPEPVLTPPTRNGEIRAFKSY